MQIAKGRLIIVIGVSGSGKSTIGKLLSDKTQIPFADADDYHPSSNIDKMKSGVALNDDDRHPWLLALNALMKESEKNQGRVLACSALKEKYRALLSADIKGEIVWVILHGDVSTIDARMRARNHFLPVDLLQSQMDTWEMPNYGLKMDIGEKPEIIVNKIIEKILMEQKSQIGLIGLGVMGKSLSRNIAGKGIGLSVYNRHVAETEENVAIDFVKAHDELKDVPSFDQLEPFVNSLASPKTIFLMVNAGGVVDSVINELEPLLSEGDIIMDGGNSHYKDTERRFQTLKDKGIQYIGTGVSGGEEGALKGPSIMPGGSGEAFESKGHILQTIAAKDKSGEGCCAFIGKGGAGHFVKMVHNGIEYAEMQLIAEVYGVLKFSGQWTNEKISELFSEWDKTGCSNYLLQITIEILKKKEGDAYILDLILDKSGNKGTGSWTTIAACELGVPIPTITAALFARYQSAQIDLRHQAAEVYKQSEVHFDIDTNKLRQAYQLARIVNHHQGYDLMQSASERYEWDINFKELSRIWTNGCIIRSELMADISQKVGNDLPLLLHPSLQPLVESSRSDLNEIVAAISSTPISAPCFQSALSYLNGFVQQRALANMIQAQRDYFGAHTYERVDAPRGRKFHTNWI